VIFYSNTILSLANEGNSLEKSAGFFAANVVATAVGLQLLDRMGRRPLLITGYSLMTVALIILSASLYFMESNNKSAVVAPITGMVVYMVGFAVGPGVTTFTFLSEMVPTKIRGRAFGLFMAVNWVCVLVLSQFTVNIINALGRVHAIPGSQGSKEQTRRGVAQLYFICLFVAMIGLFVVIVFVKETKGVMLEESALIMQRNLEEVNSAPTAPKMGSFSDSFDRTPLLLGDSAQNGERLHPAESSRPAVYSLHVETSGTVQNSSSGGISLHSSSGNTNTRAYSNGNVSHRMPSDLPTSHNDLAAPSHSSLNIEQGPGHS